MGQNQSSQPQPSPGKIQVKVVTIKEASTSPSRLPTPSSSSALSQQRHHQQGQTSRNIDHESNDAMRKKSLDDYYRARRWFIWGLFLGIPNLGSVIITSMSLRRLKAQSKMCKVFCILELPAFMFFIVGLLMAPSIFLSTSYGLMIVFGIPRLYLHKEVAMKMASKNDTSISPAPQVPYPPMPMPMQMPAPQVPYSPMPMPYSPAMMYSSPVSPIPLQSEQPPPLLPRPKSAKSASFSQSIEYSTQTGDGTVPAPPNHLQSQTENPSKSTSSRIGDGSIQSRLQPNITDSNTSLSGHDHIELDAIDKSKAGSVVRKQYILGSEWSSGANNYVRKAHDHSSGNDVALKVMKDMPVFKNEVKMLKLLKHPAIVEMYGYFSDTRSGLGVIVLQWAPNTLQAKLKRSQ